MSILFAIKLACELCVFASALSLLPWWKGAETLLLSSAGIGFVSAWLSAILKRYNIARFLPFLLYALLLPLCASPLQIIGVAAMLIYSLVPAIRRSYLIEYWEYRKLYIGTSIAFVVMSCVAAVAKPFDSVVISNCMFLYIIFGAYVLRQIRSPFLDKRSRVMDLLCLSAPFLIVWVVLSIIEWFGKQDLTILSILINIVVAPFTIIIVIIAKLGYFIATKLTSPGRTPSTEIEILPDPSEAAGNAQAMETPAPLASIEPARYPSGFDVEALLKYLPYILIGLVVIAIAAWLLSKLFNSYKVQHNGKQGQSIDVIEEAEDPDARRKLKRQRDARGRIRQIYKSYLAYINKRVCHVFPDNTSLDVLLRSAADDDGESNGLRELYIRARYSENESFTDDDIKKAKRHLNSIKAIRQKRK